MKKFFTMLAVVLALAMCMSFTAFAETVNVGEANGMASITVNGTYADGLVAQEIISVDISWGAMSFTYHDTDEGEWNDEKHEFEGTKAAYWDCEENANKITLTNHSNTVIEAQLTCTKSEGSDIVGSFTEDVGEANDGVIEIATAVGTEFDNAPSESVYFNIASGSITKDETLGTITVKIVNK